MLKSDKPNLFFQTHCPFTAVFIVFIIGYGFYSFISDCINYLLKYYN